MDIKVEFFAITISTMVADVLLYSIMDLDMLAEIALLSKPLAAADLFA